MCSPKSKSHIHVKNRDSNSSLIWLTRAAILCVTILPIHSNTSELSWVIIYSLWRYSKSSQVMQGWGWNLSHSLFFFLVAFTVSFLVFHETVYGFEVIRGDDEFLHSAVIPPVHIHVSLGQCVNSHKQENLNTEIFFFFLVLFVYCCICFIVSIVYRQ